MEMRIVINYVNYPLASREQKRDYTPIKMDLNNATKGLARSLYDAEVTHNRLIYDYLTFLRTHAKKLNLNYCYMFFMSKSISFGIAYKNIYI